MPYRMIYDYTKIALEKVSIDPSLFCKELRKANKNLLPYEIEKLKNWLENFTKGRPDLKQYLSIVNY
jgi:DNA replication protein DnaD